MCKKIQEICVTRTPPPAPPKRGPFSWLGFSEGASMTRHGHAHQPLLMSQSASPTPLTGWWFDPVPPSSSTFLTGSKLKSGIFAGYCKQRAKGGASCNIVVWIINRAALLRKLKLCKRMQYGALRMICFSAPLPRHHPCTYAKQRLWFENYSSREHAWGRKSGFADSHQSTDECADTAHPLKTDKHCSRKKVTLPPLRLINSLFAQAKDSIILP